MTGAVSELTPLRVRRPPAIDGPFDDEIDVRPPQMDGALALELPELNRSGGRVPLRLVPPAAARQDEDDDPPPPIGPWAARVTQAIAEVLAGGRAAGQLCDVATFEVLSLLERSAGRLGMRSPSQGGQICQPRVLSMHLSEPTRYVVEACAVIDTMPRRRALALRFERNGSRWQCTEMQVC